jgi:hypothetical protein
MIFTPGMHGPMTTPEPQRCRRLTAVLQVARVPRQNGMVAAAPGKLIGIFINIESQFAKHMESGLKNLKSAAER